MDGKFPAGYKKVIPVTATIDILLQKQNIRSALQRVSILANEKFKGVRLEATNKAVVLSSENPEQEEATYMTIIVFKKLTINCFFCFAKRKQTNCVFFYKPFERCIMNDI